MVMVFAVSACGSKQRADFSGLTCADLARQIETASTGEMMEVRHLHALHSVLDYRTNYQQPEGDAHSLVLRCKGPGTWSDGSKGPVMIELSVDGNRQTWLNWEPSQ
jgi:hypothetical protein